MPRKVYRLNDESIADSRLEEEALDVQYKYRIDCV